MLNDFTSKYSLRIQTGIVLLIAFLIFSIIDNFFIWWLVFGGIMLISLYEAQELLSLGKDNKKQNLNAKNINEIDESSVYIYTAILWLVALFAPNAHYLIFISLILIGSLIAYDKSFDSSIIKVLLYPIAPFLFMLALYDNYGVSYLVWLIIIVASCDISAFFGGKFFGKTSFCATSPNKTLEGVFSGVGGAIIVSLFASPSEIGFFASIGISFLVALFSIFGDLYESHLKREAGVKDSGSILPGHGGALDRLDGYLFGSVALLSLLEIFA